MNILVTIGLFIFLSSFAALGSSNDGDICEDCDLVGSLSQLCDSEAGGVCLDCKSGVGGVKCDQCLPDFYNFSDVGCSECGCHPNASMEQQCDASGVCQCIATATGDKCDVCADGYHIIESGCVSCPACYDDVAIQFNRTVESYNNLLRHINSTLTRLDGAGSGGEFVSPELLDQLENYQATLEELLVRAVNATERENEVKMLLSSLIEETDAFESDVRDLEKNVTLVENVSFELSDLLGQIRENLTQVQDMLMSAEIKLRVEIWAQLETAMRLNRQLERRFNELVELVTEVNLTSHEQEALAESLLSDITCALENATRALEILRKTIALQNVTLAEVNRIEEDILPPLFEVYMEARNVFADVDQNVPLALDEANRMLTALQNISIPQFDAERRHRELDEIEADTLQLSISASDVYTEVEPILSNFTSLNFSAVELLTESKELNALAQELLAIAHSAQALANDSVVKGNAVIDEARSILSELQEQLLNAGNFTAELEEVIRNVENVENGSVTVEEKAERTAQEVMEVASTVNMAALTLQNASLTIQEALELAGQLNQNATAVLDNATNIYSAVQSLANNVTMTTNKADRLEETVTEDKRTISVTIDTAKETIALASNTTQEIVVIQELLFNLSIELNSTTLLSPDRIASVNRTLVFLEQEAAANQGEVDALADQIRQLQDSADELRERYTELQQHRDLLRKILGNIEGLDCRKQFARFS